MDNQKFRASLTIYHTNGGVLSPTTIVFTGARREGLHTALRLLTAAADGLWAPQAAAGPAPAPAETAEPAGPAETAACAPAPDRETGVKGLLLIRCPKCQGRFIVSAKDYASEIECRCGEKIPLSRDNIARFEWHCPTCARLVYGRTNLTDAAIEPGSISCPCGEANPELLWRMDRRAYLEREA